MGDTIGTWISIVGAAAGLVVLVVGLMILARGSYNKARIAALREDLEDSRRREEDRKSEITDLQHKQRLCDSKIDGLSRENLVLKDLVTQRVEIGALQGLLEAQKSEIDNLRKALEEGRPKELAEWQKVLREELNVLGEKIEGLLQREKDHGNN